MSIKSLLNRVEAKFMKDEPMQLIHIGVDDKGFHVEHGKDVHHFDSLKKTEIFLNSVKIDGKNVLIYHVMNGCWAMLNS